MKKILLLTVLCYKFFISNAQSPEINQIQQTLSFTTDSLQYVDKLNRLAILIYEKNVDSTFFYAKQARAVAWRNNYAKGKADALDNLGAVFYIKGDLQLSLRYFHDAYNAYVDLHDSSNIIQMLMNTALVFDALGEKDKAIENFNKDVFLGKHLTKDSIMSLVYANYVILYGNKISKDSGKLFLQRAEQIASKYKDARTLVAIQQLKALQYINDGNKDVGIAMLQRVADTCASMHLYYLSIDMLINLGNAFEQIDSAKSVDYYAQALNIANVQGFQVYSKILASQLYHFYYNRNDKTKADFYSDELIKAYETEEKFNSLSGFDYIDYALKDQELTEANESNKNHTTILVLMTTFCLVAVVSGVFTFRLYRAKREQACVLQRLNNSLSSTLSNLEKAQHENMRIMNIVAHDLRNPISSIIGLTDLIAADDLQPTEKQQILMMMRKTGSIALTLIKDMLQLDNSLTNISNEAVNMHELLQYCIDMVKPKAEKKGQQIIFKPAEACITGDKEKLWRVFSNLIMNAIKFSLFNTDIVVRILVKENNVIISVQDNGIGVPNELKDKLFNLSPHAKRKGTADEPSFGLGLSISLNIVKAHNGNIWFESEQGKGTTFFVSFPLRYAVKEKPGVSKAYTNQKVVA